MCRHKVSSTSCGATYSLLFSGFKQIGPLTLWIMPQLLHIIVSDAVILVWRLNAINFTSWTVTHAYKSMENESIEELLNVVTYVVNWRWNFITNSHVCLKEQFNQKGKFRQHLLPPVQTESRGKFLGQTDSEIRNLHCRLYNDVNNIFSNQSGILWLPET